MVRRHAPPLPYAPAMQLVDFSEHFVVRLPLTDAAGVLFYARIFEIEEELFERWLELGGFSLRSMLDGSLAPTPIVRCEADFRRPVRVGDKLAARLYAVDIGRSGYTLAWSFSLGHEQVMSAKVKRVAIDRESGESVDLPEVLRTWLEETQSRTGRLG
jgi:1,4-dihydroxy-2-naphthoyl-CoA hydrolase